MEQVRCTSLLFALLLFFSSTGVEGVTLPSLPANLTSTLTGLAALLPSNLTLGAGLNSSALQSELGSCAQPGSDTCGSVTDCQDNFNITTCPGAVKYCSKACLDGQQNFYNCVTSTTQKYGVQAQAILGGSSLSAQQERCNKAGIPTGQGQLNLASIILTAVGCFVAFVAVLC